MKKWNKTTMLKWCKMKMAFPSANRKKTVEATLSYWSNYVQVFDWAKQTYLFTLKIQQECDEPAANRNRASSLQILMWAEQICVDFPTFFFYFAFYLVSVLFWSAACVIKSIWQSQTDFGIFWINKNKRQGLWKIASHLNIMWHIYRGEKYMQTECRRREWVSQIQMYLKDTSQSGWHAAK